MTRKQIKKELKIEMETSKKRENRMMNSDCMKVQRQINNYLELQQFLCLMKQDEGKTFKETYTKEKRIKMYEDGQLKNKDNIIVIIQRDPKCRALPDLKHCRFSIAGDQKIMEVCDAIRKRILKIDQKYQSQSFFLFTNKILPNKQISVKDLYNTHKDPEDGLLYLMYSNLDPYGFE